MNDRLKNPHIPYSVLTSKFTVNKLDHILGLCQTRDTKIKTRYKYPSHTLLKELIQIKQSCESSDSWEELAHLRN